ncbi:MAG: restriction endonuclease [Brevinematia bacterium]
MELLIVVSFAVIFVFVGYYVSESLFKDPYKTITQLKERGEYEEALKRLLRLFSKRKDDVRVIYELAEVNKFLGNNLEAIGYYLNLIKKDVFPPITTKGEVLKEVGLLYYKENQIKEAFFYLYYASYFLPTDKDINYALFKILFEQENFQLADTFGQRAFPFFSKDGNFLSDYGFVKIELNRYADAIEILEKAYSLSKSVKARVFLAFTLAKLGGYRRVLDLVSDLITDSNIPDKIMVLIYRLIVFSYLSMKSFNETMKYWDQFLTFANSKEFHSLVREIGFGIFMSYLFFSRYDRAKEMLATLKEFEISDATINSIAPFIDEAIKNLTLKKEGKSYDIRPMKEIENYCENWISSMLRVNELFEVFYVRKSLKDKIDVIQIIKDVQEQINVFNKDLDKFMKNAGEGLSTDEQEDICDMFVNRLDSKTFETISDELVNALGFNVIKKLSEEIYLEFDGYDYICSKPKDPQKYYVAIRRWGINEIGKIPIVDIKQKSVENNCDKVFIVSSAPLTSEAQDFVEKNGIEFKICKEIAGILKAIIPYV